MDKLISSEWLKNAIHNFYKGLNHEPTEEDIQAYIDAAPPVKPQPDDAISRQEILNKINEVCFSEKWKEFRIDYGSNGQRDFLIDYIKQMLPINPKSHIKLTNREWISFLAEQFNISRTSAKEMLHVMMSVKKEDNFKKQFNRKDQANEEKIL